MFLDYRVDIAQAPLAKKKYRVRMAPTTMFIITRRIIIDYKYKAGLDLELPVSVEEIQCRYRRSAKNPSQILIFIITTPIRFTKKLVYA